jgi:hypothetical protein
LLFSLYPACKWAVTTAEQLGKAATYAVFTHSGKIETQHRCQKISLYLFAMNAAIMKCVIDIVLYMNGQILINIAGIFCSTLEEQKLQNEKQVSELKIKKHIEKREMREKREVQDRLQSGNTEQGKVLEEELKLGQQQSEERRISQEKLLQVLLSLFSSWFI